MKDKRKETKDGRKETRDRRKETREGRKEMRGIRKETREVRKETRDRRKESRDQNNICASIVFKDKSKISKKDLLQVLKQKPLNKYFFIFFCFSFKNNSTNVVLVNIFENALKKVNNPKKWLKWRF